MGIPVSHSHTQEVYLDSPQALYRSSATLFPLASAVMDVLPRWSPSSQFSPVVPVPEPVRLATRTIPRNWVDNEPKD